LREDSVSEAGHLTQAFEAAMTYALHVHGGQLRKGTAVPYAAHLLAVAATVMEYGGDEEMAMAALLHDAAEDQGGEPRLADIRQRFGARVGGIVEACSDSLTETGAAKAPWRRRKQRYLDHLAERPAEVLLVSLADKVHNARSILRDSRRPEIGQAVWRRFSQPVENTLWYYRELARAFQKHLPGQLADELAEIVDVLELEAPAPGRQG
jgi:(p)ppGpp synthase/HD superfamily hydrolase